MLRRSLMPASRMRLPSRIIDRMLARFRTRRDRRISARPVAPRAFVETHVLDAGELHREQVVARIDPRAAVHDGASVGVDADLLEAPAQLLARLEQAVVLQVARERRVARAWDVAGPGVDGLFLAAVALARS